MRDKVVVITGGGSGIGRAVALQVASLGGKVAILDINESNAKAVSEKSLELGASNAIAVRCDVSSDKEVKDAFANVETMLGAVDGLFANAGIGTGGGFVHESETSVWDKVIGINLTGIYLCSKYALQSMIKAKKQGSIVCTSSPTGFTANGAGGVAAYGASKAGVSALVRCMAVDYASYGIRVNAVVPGATETTLMWDNVPENEIASMRRTVNSEIPIRRLAMPDEIAQAVVWLLSDKASYCTGSHLVCDGGILAKSSISV